MKLLVAVSIVLCLSFVRTDTPADEVPIEKPRIVNTEIPPSEIVERENGNIVIVEDPPTPPPPPPFRSFPAQDSSPSIDEIGAGQINVDAENLNKYLEKVLESVKQEVGNTNVNGGSLPNVENKRIGAENSASDNLNNVDQRLLDEALKNAQAEIDKFSASQAALFGTQDIRDPVIETQRSTSEQSRSNSPDASLDFSTGPATGPINTLPDLGTISTTDNFDSDDAKRLVQLIEERRELLRQLREQDQVVNNPTLDDARSAPFRTTPRLSDDFDDFGILRPSIPPGLSPLVGNSIGVPVNTVTDSESQRNNRPSDLLADAGNVNAPATIRQIFRDGFGGNFNLPSRVPGFGTGQVLPTDSLDDNQGDGLDDGSDQRRNALLAHRQLLERQLALVSGQTLPTTNTASPLGITSNLNSVPFINRIPIGNFDDNFQVSGVNMNEGDDDFGSLGRRSQQTQLQRIPGLFSPDIGLANVLASRNRNQFVPQSIPTLRRPPPQGFPSGFSENSVFRSPNSRFSSRDLLLRQFQRGPNRRSLSSDDLDDGRSVTGTHLQRFQRFPSPLGSIRPGSGIDLLQQTRNNLGIPGVSSTWRQGSRNLRFSSSDDDGPLVQSRGSQLSGFSSSLDDLRPGRGLNIPPRIPGVSSPLDNARSNVLNLNRNNPFFIPGILPSFGVSTSDDDSADIRSNSGSISGDVRSDNRGVTGFPTSFNNIRPGGLGLAPPQSLLRDDDSSSGDIRSDIRGALGFSSSLSSLRPGTVGPAPPQSSPWTAPFGTFNRPQVPLPPSTILDDDDGNTRDILRPEEGRISGRTEDFPEFSRQVEQLLQSASRFDSFSRGSFNDDDNFRGPFSRRRFIPHFRNVNTLPSFAQPRGSLLPGRRGIF